MSSLRNSLLLCIAPLLLVKGAQAQSNSCELLKQTLASRIPPEIKGYAMDDVPARTPVPPGGKVIGTCEGGARKVIYRRFGGAPLAVDGGAASAPAPAAATAMPAASAPAPTVAQKDAPKPEVPKPRQPEPVKPVTPPAPTPAPAPAPAPVAVAPKPAPVPPPPTPAATPTPAADRSAVASPPSRQSIPSADTPQPGFLEAYGRWLWLLLALPLAAWLWSWVSHRMAYDKAGLPRGPRL